MNMNSILKRSGYFILITFSVVTFAIKAAYCQIVVRPILCIPNQKLQKASNTDSQFELLALLEKNRVFEGDPIRLRLSLSNKTGEIMKFYSIPEKDCELSIKDQKGKTLAMTDYGQALKRHTEREETIEMTGISHNYIIVNRIFQITLAGTYSIAAKRTFLHPKTKQPVVIESNTVDVTVCKSARKLNWGALVSDLQLVIYTEPDSPSSGRDIVLHGMLRNGSHSKVISFLEDIVSKSNYEIVVINPEKHILEMKENAAQLKQRTKRWVHTSLGPSEVLRFSYGMSQAFDFSRPGVYTITVKRSGDSGEVVSNTIKLVISPASPRRF